MTGLLEWFTPRCLCRFKSSRYVRWFCNYRNFKLTELKMPLKEIKRKNRTSMNSLNIEILIPSTLSTNGRQNALKCEFLWTRIPGNCSRFIFWWWYHHETSLKKKINMGSGASSSRLYKCILSNYTKYNFPNSICKLKFVTLTPCLVAFFYWNFKYLTNTKYRQ